MPNSASFSQAKAHLFKLFHACLPIYTELREKLGKVGSLEDVCEVADEITERLKNDYGNQIKFNDLENIKEIDGIKQFPVWVAQPFFRKALPIEEAKKRTADASKVLLDQEKKDRKKLRKELLVCNNCSNVKSVKCQFSLCRVCCKQLENGCKH